MNSEFEHDDELLVLGSKDVELNSEYHATFKNSKKAKNDALLSLDTIFAYLFLEHFFSVPYAAYGMLPTVCIIFRIKF